MGISHWPDDAAEAYERMEDRLAASKAREEAYRAEIVKLSGELSAKDSEIDRLNRIKSRTRQEELVQQLAEREKQIVLLRVELKRIADQLFDVLGGSTKGYYHGLKENMCVALAALAAIFEREGK